MLAPICLQTMTASKLMIPFSSKSLLSYTVELQISL
jgi:hypothetical protein